MTVDIQEFIAPAAMALPVVQASAAGPLDAPGRRLLGYSLREATSQAPAVVELLDGGDQNGSPIAEVSLAAGQSQTVWLAPGGVRYRSGLYLSVLSGTVQGSIWTI